MRQAQRTRSPSHLSPGRPRSAMPNARRDGALIAAKSPCDGGVGGAFRLQREIENLLLLAAEQRQNAVRRQLGQRLEEVEIIGIFRALLLLAVAHLRDDPPARPEIFAQTADQLGLFGKLLDQNRARAVERLLGRRHALGFDEILPPLACGSRLGIGEQRRRPAARGRSRGRSAPWCGAWACKADRCPRAAPWCRRR